MPKRFNEAILGYKWGTQHPGWAEMEVLPSSWRVEELISAAAFLIVFAIQKLPYEQRNGRSVPGGIFKDKSSFFHAFLLALNFGFTGAVISISLRKKHPKASRYCRHLALASMIVAGGVVMWLRLPSVVFSL
ncbi:hypothetical protein NMG60_11009660 [Bertholletia excelsa]